MPNWYMAHSDPITILDDEGYVVATLPGPRSSPFHMHYGTMVLRTYEMHDILERLVGLVERTQDGSEYDYIKEELFPLAKEIVEEINEKEPLVR